MTGSHAGRRRESDPPTIAELAELAFDFRGDVTLVTADGGELQGYVYNRDVTAAEPYVEVLPADGSGARLIPYAVLSDIRFTGRDAAALYAGWLRRRRAARVEGP